MTIKDYRDGKIIILSKAFDSRAKTLNLISFIVFFVMATFFLKMLLINEAGTVGIIFIVLISLLFYFVSYRYANKAVLTEKMFVNKNRLELIRQGLFKSKKEQFDITNISRFRHLAKPELTSHPLSGGSFDYLGFQTQQQVINELHGDNRMSFDYNGRTITFGDNIYSWDFEALEILLYDVTGNDLRYNDEFEKNMLSNNDEELPA